MRQRKAKGHKLAVDSATFAPMCSGRDRAYRGGWLQTEPQIGRTRGGAGASDPSSVGVCRLDGSGELAMKVQS
jgi:hypothetical protein